MSRRHRTFPVKVGSVTIGGTAPVTIQSMTNTDTKDTEKTLAQIKDLVEAGCQLVRVAIPDEESVNSFKTLTQFSPVPLIADIHFSYQLAIKAIEAGASKIRINPGNIGSRQRVAKVVEKAKTHNVPIRVGINSGSVEKNLLQKYGGPTPSALVESAVNNVMMLSEMGFGDVVVSIKASDVNTTVKANQEFATRLPNPLHLGITEAGTIKQGTIKSSVGIGTLLSHGIGDTLRVSLSGSPIEEVSVARGILSSLNLAEGPRIVSCPTCARSNISVEDLASTVEDRLKDLNTSLTVAVMGCEVNGPGEAKEADIGIAGSKEYGVLFKKGKIIDRVPKNQLLEVLSRAIDEYIDEIHSK
ncbi:flavodoxin-dependent (E)-4-hydroxy-3-methylbut-2-enyl-diphosphate synthase [Natranaerobius thermophilus]|uniref:4-hydroxy-3-methylbut-2-en-1-yl diphosphate synthase (flavodoxin) n=1 Tax=Natranaerobius thermophilus (strain ATCC BAA-1301 / DSM 18059 / JW/NM-WN-LF) TaxID=457570 RepID=ISPG_NATTJ|nr:flavodoxin-dependent (E)-4-hydroxy-3-methylbut-2-enyl-diphosphate synthase [Natranaerobius thermophilus]B2A390.1 RecName: Full=4-hydroxy-3-methylbut-2-en-1-yl diphosphate synthase (flavodoxin); AltName: Full=1-hydroxy-2-methyl-2-(E)-butenyl 4-diphosphate synthase [Natranaerobius thermophilus JW/NM-WN-LF]ACB85020.1 4-hydroxy-3-methylbut-2-en-1-yl diphosphate synthase [Natranaerobius thermophilus JW/NM-WN-LF]